MADHTDDTISIGHAHSWFDAIQFTSLQGDGIAQLGYTVVDDFGRYQVKFAWFFLTHQGDASGIRQSGQLVFQPVDLLVQVVILSKQGFVVFLQVEKACHRFLKGIQSTSHLVGRGEEHTLLEVVRAEQQIKRHPLKKGKEQKGSDFCKKTHEILHSRRDKPVQATSTRRQRIRKLNLSTFFRAMPVP